MALQMLGDVVRQANKSGIARLAHRLDARRRIGRNSRSSDASLSLESAQNDVTSVAPMMIKPSRVSIAAYEIASPRPRRGNCAGVMPSRPGAAFVDATGRTESGIVDGGVDRSGVRRKAALESLQPLFGKVSLGR